MKWIELAVNNDKHLMHLIDEFISLCLKSFYFSTPLTLKQIALSGNRTRAARVAGEHSTTEPTMLPY